MKNYFRLIAEDEERGLLAGLLKPLLSGVSVFYRGGVVALQALYQKGILPRRRLPFPVISIGNLTWGGTGKTPLVEYFARRVIERRKTPLVLTRGYGLDEVRQLQNHLPHLKIGVGKERYRVARRMSRKDRIDVAILDDGFQHWRVKRDIEIVTVNALNPFGNGRLFPRGILREPETALRRASVVVLTHVNLVTPQALGELRDQIRQIAPQAFLVESYLEPLFFYRPKKRFRVPLAELREKRVATFSGIAHPRSFQLLLTHLGLKPLRNFEFSDHHSFTGEELLEIREVARKSEVQEIITTEKDFHRSASLISQTLNPLVMAVRLRIASGEEILKDRIFRLLGVG